MSSLPGFPDHDDLWPVSPIKAFTIGAGDRPLVRTFVLLEFSPLTRTVLSLRGRAVIVDTWADALVDLIRTAADLRLWAAIESDAGERAIVEWLLPSVSLTSPTVEKTSNEPAEIEFAGEAMPGPDGRWYDWRPLAVKRGETWAWVK